MQPYQDNRIIKFTLYIIGILLVCAFRFSPQENHASIKQLRNVDANFFAKMPLDTIPRDTISKDSVLLDTLIQLDTIRIDSTFFDSLAVLPTTAAPAPIAVEFSTVNVWYATDRNKTEDKIPFGTNRSTISYGQCEVTIPKIHQMGEIESRTIFEWFFDDDPAKHMIVKKTSHIAASTFFSKLSANINASGDKSAFIFIHGYNTSFEDAAKRTAQISYDLKFTGAPIFFSWPSQGQFQKYTVDEANIEWTQPDVEKFLIDFLKKTTAQNLYIIAHSMGNRAMTRAINSVTTKFPAYRKRIKAIVLAAPDIDSDVFKRDIAPGLTGACKNITLYTSKADKALKASREVHGSSRLGDNRNGVVTIPGIESVDASNVDSDFLGHSYFSSTKTIISDIFYIIKEGKPASQRFGLEKVNAAPLPYWRFSK